ncbi:MAG: FAD-dependent thymidylate synthase [Candidatus Scalindua sp. AMX11]|nr:MAG: FAD-dependent thymidylate synthase [Candidatus Scalindua sp.]NOG86074.1 FAD-dependent thymidylate synthase [Planctomycetota bacterium]RZV98842.1 MAG: FAD-dependent thymidylate synthase [Candidatus Scalindua sp. SCAELEC01]TDE66968.1 MAG: FAD-dependent thymidylate synthase [Candidatus Scalindua sp. AMX11]GJQ57776.1 MAG: flavin-dependent thymidylate synthase [Candidatus Scalindua sp.]
MAQATLKVILLNHTKSPEETIAHAAKLCYSPASIEQLKGTVEKSDNEKFVARLLQLGHLSPLEHAIFTFGIEGVSRACSHQLVRHRIASYSQQSQRYVGERRKKEHETFDFVVPPSIEASGKREWFVDKMREIQDWYDELVEVLGDSGEKSNEDARFILPNAAETKIIVTMNVRELIHFFSVRCCERAQWEIRALATEMLRLTRAVLPSVFFKSGPNCVKGACTEGKMTCGHIEEVRERFRNL